MGRQIEVRAECPWCGPLVVEGERFRCEIDTAQPSKGLCELTCPGCSRPILFPTTAAAVRTLLEAGGQHLGGAVPFELLEPHAGAVLSWDDLLDFKLALDRTPWPQLELTG